MAYNLVEALRSTQTGRASTDNEDVDVAVSGYISQLNFYEGVLASLTWKYVIRCSKDQINLHVCTHLVLVVSTQGGEVWPGQVKLYRQKVV